MSFSLSSRLSAALLLICCLLLSACQGDEAADKPASGMPPAAVAIEKPVLDSMQESTVVVGSLSAAQSALLAAEIAGRLEVIHITDGQSVKKGTLLFEVGSDALRAELKRAKALVNLRRQEKNRIESLRQKNVGSQYDVDKAVAELLTAEATLELAQAKFQQSLVRAPFAGQLGIRLANEGAYLDSGTALIELVQLNTLLLDFNVPEKALQTIQVGHQLPVEIPSLNNLATSAEIVAISPSVNVKTRSVQVRAKIDNPDGLMRPGLFARIQLANKSEEQLLWVSEAAIFYEGEDTLLLTHQQGKALRKKVSIASYQNGRVAIRSGLLAEDEVVVSGHHKAPFDGMPLMVTNAAEFAAPEPEANKASAPNEAVN